jgi:hypothetical protein
MIRGVLKTFESVFVKLDVDDLRLVVRYELWPLCFLGGLGILLTVFCGLRE